MNRSCLSSVRGASSPVVMVTPPPLTFHLTLKAPRCPMFCLRQFIAWAYFYRPDPGRPCFSLFSVSFFSGVCSFCRQTVTVVAMTGYNYRFRNVSYDKVTCWFIAWARYLTPVPFIDFVNFSPFLLSAIYDNKLINWIYQGFFSFAKQLKKLKPRVEESECVCMATMQAARNTCIMYLHVKWTPLRRPRTYCYILQQQSCRYIKYVIILIVIAAFNLEHLIPF